MTPEEHIEMAEKIIANYRNEADSIRASEVHVSIAFFKKQYPPETGRPIVKYPMGQLGVQGGKPPYPGLPDDHPMNKGRPISDNPQA